MKQNTMKVEGSEVVTGSRHTHKPDENSIRSFEENIGFLQSNNIEKILEFPDITDMAGVLARANFKNDEQRTGAVLLAYKNRKFKDNTHQEMLRDHCASTLGARGLGKILQTFVGTNLLAPDMLRIVFGMPKSQRPEEVHRGRNSDLRADGVEKEDKND